MAFRVEIAAAAQIEADEILKWLIEQHAGETGLRWFLALYDAIDSLETFPQRRPVAPENNVFPEEIRLLLYGRKPRQRIHDTKTGSGSAGWATAVHWHVVAKGGRFPLCRIYSIPRPRSRR